MIDLIEIGKYIGALVVLWGLVKEIVKPFKTAIEKMERTLSEQNESTQKLNTTLIILTNDLEASKADRIEIHKRLDEHEHELNKQDRTLNIHSERIRTLFKEWKK